MPEGHTIHRLAREQLKLFGGRPVHASSPQGRFGEGAAMINGRRLLSTEANGKHLLHHYEGDRALHIHLGLYGKFSTGAGAPPEPRGALRLRLENSEHWTDLRGATACELIEPHEIKALYARLGPDPLRSDAEPQQAYRKLSRSRTSIAALLMDQAVIAGIGNVYRAEILFRHRINPFLSGQLMSERGWQELWADLVVLMRFGVRTGRIVTVEAADRPRKRGVLSRDEAHYVYRRAGLPCRVCRTEVLTQLVVGRNLFWCPSCQAA